MEKKTIYWSFRANIAKLVILLAVSLSAAVTIKAQHPLTTADGQKLTIGKPIARLLKGGKSHVYEVTLAVNQFLRVVVLQQGIDVVVQVSDPDGKPLFEADSPNGTRGEEPVSLIADIPGTYQLKVTSLEQTAPAGRYVIRWLTARPATDKDRAAIAKDRLLQEANRLQVEANNLYQAGKYEAAIPPAERSLAIRQQVLGDKHPYTATSLSDLAEIYQNKGDYTKAEPLLIRAVAIREQTLGKMHPDTATALDNLALLYHDKGDFDKAEQLYLRVQAIYEKSLSKADPDLAISLDNLASLYVDKGEYDKAERLYQRALSIYEKTVGEMHRDTAISLDNLAYLYYEKGEYDKAEPLYLRALTVSEKTLGAEHPETATLLNNMALLYEVKGDYAKAANYLVRSLTIFSKTLGAEHPYTAQTLNDLALLFQAMGNIEKAVTLQNLCNDSAERDFIRNLAAGSERQRRAYLNQTAHYLDVTLTLHTRFAPTDLQARQMAIKVLLQRKGRALDATTDAITALRRHASADDQKLLDRVAEARSQFSNATLKGAGKEGFDKHQENLKALAAQVEKLEAELSRRSVEFRAQALPVTLEAVQALIPDDAALIEFAAFRPYDMKEDTFGERHYVAYLLTKTGEPQWADVGEATTIDKAIKEFRAALQQKADGKLSDLKGEVMPKARALDELIMHKLRSLLGDKKHLLISPDGSLNLIPFDALVDEKNHYLVESYSISYLTSGRDLLRLQGAKSNNKAALVFADPDFDLSATPVKASATADTRIAQRMSPAQQNKERIAQRLDSRPGPKLGNVQLQPFKRLPGSAAEGAELKNLLPNAAFMTAAQATETALKHAVSPSILHISTHGGFLEDESKPEAKEQRGLQIRPGSLDSVDETLPSKGNVEDALLRSGLFFAGANQGQSGADDGVLTALEAKDLDLYGTKLVVLSACETGVGEVKNGDGVYGLRRALVLAGSETQVMSLWSVSDEGTRELMIDYYKRLLQGEGRGEALRQVRLQMLTNPKRQHPYYWASFIQSGEWANLDGKR
jgi:CHAT domain-containing protein/Tfp pilus assembly protein PilF